MAVPEIFALTSISESHWGRERWLLLRRVRIFMPGSDVDYTEQWWVEIGRLGVGLASVRLLLRGGQAAVEVRDAARALYAEAADAITLLGGTVAGFSAVLGYSPPLRRGRTVELAPATKDLVERLRKAAT